MQAAIQPQPKPPTPQEPHTPAAQDACVSSDSLLLGKKSVAIMHNGSVYRLQATKLGKLILTK